MAASVGLSVLGGSARTRHADRGSGPSALEQLEEVYRANVGPVSGYFARRCSEPQTVADLTLETFLRAAAGFARFDPRRGSPRAWFQREGRALLERCARLSDVEREAIELVDLAGLTPKEAADALGASAVVMRKRLSRARRRLRKEHDSDDEV